MSELTENREFLQSFLNVASLLLQLDIQIFDCDRQCVAAAGSEAISKSIGKYLREDGIVARRYLKGERRIHVTHPGFSADCQGCAAYQQNRCLYKNAFFSPIEVEGSVVGIIGISSSGPDDRTKNIETQVYDFVEALAVLIADRLMENLHYKKIQAYSNFLKAAISSIQKGVILLNTDNQIAAVNEYIEKQFELSADDLKQQSVCALFPHLDSETITKMCSEGKPWEFGWKNKIFLAEIVPIYNDGEITGTILMLDDIRDTYQLAYQIAEQPQDLIFGDILGSDPGFVEFKRQVHSVAGYDSTILLTGETGSGKELFARAIHAASRRKDGPFVIVNCGAIPDSLIESELFGYERGAFTGANTSGKYGKFYLADKGTLFLDELENTPLYMQQKLLRVLETGEIERVGGTKPVPVDVRVIAASNRKLEDMVREGTFRQDLYHRLSVIPFLIPPLRDRGEDVLLLTAHFIKKFNCKYDKKIEGISEQVRQLFRTCRWEGNIRELQNTIEYAVSMCPGAVIQMEHMPFSLRSAARPQPITRLREVELAHIRRAVDYFGWTDEGKTRAARHLGISRATIYRKLKELDSPGP